MSLETFAHHTVSPHIPLVSESFNINQQSKIDTKTQVYSARQVIERVVGKKYSDQLILEIINQENDRDVFEVEVVNKKIVIRGSSGVSICAGFNHYLKYYCNCIYTWRGTNLNMPKKLPVDFSKIRKVSPYKYRFIFNYCVFGYSFAFWDWNDWGKMIDWMALNGINMPLAIGGQEIIWQRVYEKYGLNRNDLDDFFVGPAYNAWGRMGNLDGWGGPLPQSWIEQDTKLQHKILERERSLGMTPVLQGFSGHVPKALAYKHKNIVTHDMSWCDFPPIKILDWQESLFSEIGTSFLKEMINEYGTDHYYAIDPFTEMHPTSNDTVFLKNMSASIYNNINSVDPQGKWLLQTWSFKNPEIKEDFWQKNITKSFFEGVPDNKLIALELFGDNWGYTSWYKLDSFWGKEWIWGIIQDFGDRVGMFGYLSQIIDHYKKVLDSPAKGNLSGMGIFMEGLGYNSIAYELVADMMWEHNLPNVDTWKWQYVKSRYGSISPELRKAWENIFDYFYTQPALFTGTVIVSSPGYGGGDHRPDKRLAEACKYLLLASKDYKNLDSYQYDLINVFREAFGSYASHMLFQVKSAYRNKDVIKYQQTSQNFIEYISEFDELLGSREEFLLGKWVNDAISHGKTDAEKRLYEWNAKNIITFWGPRGHSGCGGLYGYAMKIWSGFIKEYSLPAWKMFFERELQAMKESRECDQAKLYNEIFDHYENWRNEKGNYSSKPIGNCVAMANKLWNKYGADLSTGEDIQIIETPKGIAVNKKVSATSYTHGNLPQFAVDGNVNLEEAWWAAPYPQSLTVDLGKQEIIYGFHVIPYWDGDRYYQYTIEASEDNINWDKIVDMSQNTEISTPNGFQHIFKIKYPDGIKAKYLRLNMLYNSANEGVHVVEFKVFKGDDIP